MKLTYSLLALSALVAHGRFVEQHETDQVILDPLSLEQETFLVELSPGETRWVTEEEKWELRRVSEFNLYCDDD